MIWSEKNCKFKLGFEKNSDQEEKPWPPTYQMVRPLIKSVTNKTPFFQIYNYTDSELLESDISSSLVYLNPSSKSW